MAKEFYLSKYTGREIDNLLSKNEDSVRMKVVCLDSEGNEVIKLFKFPCVIDNLFVKLYDGDDWDLISINNEILKNSDIIDYKDTTIEVEFGSEITEISTDSFLNFSKLESIKITSNITKIDEKAFNGCNLNTVIFNSETVPEVDGNAFIDGIQSNGQLWIPSKNLYDNYKNIIDLFPTTWGIYAIDTNDYIILDSEIETINTAAVDINGTEDGAETTKTVSELVNEINGED